MLPTRPKSGHFLMALSCLLCLSATGCGPSKGSVSGKVTLDGVALQGGRVDFANGSGGPSASVEIGSDGTYTISSLVAGDYTVTVTTEYLKTNASAGRPGAAMNNPPAGMAKGGAIPKESKPGAKVEMPGNPADYGYKAAMPGDSAKKYVKVPAKYSDPAQSGLTYAFPGGTTTYDIPMVGGGK